MASTISSTPTTYLLPRPFRPIKATIFPISSSSSSLLLNTQTTNYHLSTSISQLGLGLLSPWNGFRRLGTSIKKKFTKIERKERCKGNVVHASLFGVGAPEALVIGVVALLVFGPKGLAEVARNLGKTLRAFQPTIRELQDVSREFKSTLEREIGLDDIPPSMQNTRSPTSSSPPNDQNSKTTLDPNGTPLANKPYSTEDYLKTTEEQLQAMAAQQQTIPQEQSENQSQVQEVAPAEKKPFNIGEVLVQAQRDSSAAQKQEQAVPQEASQESPQEAEAEVQPQPTVPEAASATPLPKKLEGET